MVMGRMNSSLVPDLGRVCRVFGVKLKKKVLVAVERWMLNKFKSCNAATLTI